MAELILTEEDKAALTWLELPDEFVGKFTKALGCAMKEGADELQRTMFSASTMCLATTLAKTNTASGEFLLEDLTVDDEHFGDWRIKIERLPPNACLQPPEGA